MRLEVKERKEKPGAGGVSRIQSNKVSLQKPKFPLKSHFIIKIQKPVGDITQAFHFHMECIF